MVMGQYPMNTLHDANKVNETRFEQAALSVLTSMDGLNGPDHALTVLTRPIPIPKPGGKFVL